VLAEGACGGTSAAAGAGAGATGPGPGVQPPPPPQRPVKVAEMRGEGQ